MFVVVYEAGKGIKTSTSTPQTPAYPPYFVAGVPTMVPIAPPSLVDKISTVPPSDGSLLTAGEVVLFFITKWISVLRLLKDHPVGIFSYYWILIYKNHAKNL